jgi:hypothetical protein
MFQGVTTTPPISCSISSVELLTINGQNAGLGSPFLPLPPAINGNEPSQAYPNILGATNNPNGDITKGEYRYSLMVLWRGKNLDLCTFKRWVSRTLYLGNRNPKGQFSKGRGWLGATGEATPSDEPDDGYGVYLFLPLTVDYVLQSDVPGWQPIPPRFYKAEYLANYYAAAFATPYQPGDTPLGWITYNLEIRVGQLNDPNPQNGPPYVVKKFPP